LDHADSRAVKGRAGALRGDRATIIFYGINTTVVAVVYE
jgi:hypothetical protein